MLNEVDPEKLFRKPQSILGIDLSEQVSVRMGTKSKRPRCKPVDFYDGKSREVPLRMALLNLYLQHYDDSLPAYVRVRTNAHGIHIDTGSSRFKIYSWMEILRK